MFWAAVSGVAAGVVVVSAAGTALLCRALRQRAILDHPNERSSHSVPTPRGAGLAVVGALLAGWLALALIYAGGGLWLILGAGAALAAFSWLDDLRTLSVGPRLAVQAGAIAAGLFSLSPDALVFQGTLPLVLDRLLAGLLWLWFVNLYNFMDGIDGITGVETATIAGGMVVLGAAIGTTPILAGFALIALAAGAAFLPWNWHPARIFLGDVGSVPLGFLVGWLLLALAASGQWPAALILPAYYLGDATLTLARRAARGDAVWRAHREHAYQRSVQGGRSHDATVTLIGIANLGLVGLACASVLWPGATLPALGAAVVLTGALLWYLPRPMTRSSDD